MNSIGKAADRIPDTVRTAIWNCHLDGWRVSEIARYSYQLFPATDEEMRECSSADVRRILSDAPPEQILRDPRHVHGVRAFWIAASGRIEDEDISVEGMVVVFQPHHLIGRIFQKAVRSVCRDFRSLSPGGRIEPHVMEGVEMEPVLNMLHSGKTIGWIISEEGEVSRYSGQFAPSEDSRPEGDVSLPNP